MYGTGVHLYFCKHLLYFAMSGDLMLDGGALGVEILRIILILNKSDNRIILRVCTQLLHYIGTSRLFCMPQATFHPRPPPPPPTLPPSRAQTQTCLLRFSFTSFTKSETLFK